MPRGEAEIVQRDHDGLAFGGNPAKDLHRGDLCCRVEPGNGFVGHQQRRFLGQRAGDQHAGLFAARKVIGGAVAEALELHPSDRTVHRCPVFGAQPAAARQPGGAAQPDHRLDIDAPGDLAALRHPGGLAGTGVRRQIGDIALALMRQKAQRGTQQRGLAGAVGADQADTFARPDPQRDMIDHRAAAAMHREVLQSQKGGHANSLRVL